MHLSKLPPVAFQESDEVLRVVSGHLNLSGILPAALNIHHLKQDCTTRVDRPLYDKALHSHFDILCNANFYNVKHNSALADHNLSLIHI